MARASCRSPALRLQALAACLLVLCLAHQACARRQDDDGYYYADEAAGYETGYDKDYGDWLTNGYSGKAPDYTPGEYYQGVPYQGQPEQEYSYGYDDTPSYKDDDEYATPPQPKYGEYAPYAPLQGDEYDSEYDYYRGGDKPKPKSMYGGKKAPSAKKDDGYGGGGKKKKARSPYHEDEEREYYEEDDYGHGSHGRRHGYGGRRHRGGYGRRPPPPPPTCGPNQWRDIPICVDRFTGVRVNITNVTICKITATQWCRNATGTKYFCAYSYRPSTAICRGRAGPCDRPEFCNGTKPDCPKDTFLPNNTVCERSDRVCIKDAFCSGKSATCNPHKRVRNGTPCRREGEDGAGLYSEVYEDGRLALLQAEASTAALPAGKKKGSVDKHGTVTCDRCYEGHCKEFQWEWWSHSKETKEHYKRAYGSEYDEQAPYKGYSPQFYCNRDYNGAEAQAGQQ